MKQQETIFQITGSFPHTHHAKISNHLLILFIMNVYNMITICCPNRHYYLLLYRLLLINYRNQSNSL